MQTAPRNDEENVEDDEEFESQQEGNYLGRDYAQ